MSSNLYMFNMQRVLFIAAALHEKGYGKLKIIPSLSPSGLSWRCSLISETDREVIVSKWIQHKFDISLNRIEPSISQLADLFIEEHKDFLKQCIGNNKEYIDWFKGILEILDEEELPYAFSDYFGPTVYWLTSLGKKLYLIHSEAEKMEIDSNEVFDYRTMEQIIKSFYQKKGYGTNFKNDLLYLQTSFDKIKNIWLKNLDEIDKINYIMIAEAPLWGNKRNYIYNPATNFSQFFFKSDLEDVLRISIDDKQDFINRCNKIGLLIIDISPFALNQKDTCLSYRTLGKTDYKKLIESTVPFYFEKKIEMMKSKLSPEPKVFFRYKRVKDSFETIIGKTLIEHNVINSLEEIGDISQVGGGINKSKLKEIISNHYYI